MESYFPKEATQMANRHMIKCASSFIISKIQIKPTKRYFLTPVQMAHIKNLEIARFCWWGCGKKETLIYSWWECCCFNLHERNMKISPQIIIDLTYDLVIPLLGIHPKAQKH